MLRVLRVRACVRAGRGRGAARTCLDSASPFSLPPTALHAAVCPSRADANASAGYSACTATGKASSEMGGADMKVRARTKKWNSGVGSTVAR